MHLKDSVFKRTASWYAHLENFSPNFSSWSFKNLLYPLPSLFLYVCFYLLVNYYFEVSFCLKAILNVAKISQNVAIELLKATIF